MVKKVNPILTNDTSDLVKKADYNTKFEDIDKKTPPSHDKYITTNDFIKFSGAIFDERLKQSKLATSNDFNTVEQHAIRHAEKT